MIASRTRVAYDRYDLTFPATTMVTSMWWIHRFQQKICSYWTTDWCESIYRKYSFYRKYPAWMMDFWLIWVLWCFLLWVKLTNYRWWKRMVLWNQELVLDRKFDVGIFLSPPTRMKPWSSYILISGQDDLSGLHETLREFFIYLYIQVIIKTIFCFVFIWDSQVFA